MLALGIESAEEVSSLVRSVLAAGKRGGQEVEGVTMKRARGNTRRRCLVVYH